jgi:hypothetical protein
MPWRKKRKNKKSKSIKKDLLEISKRSFWL